MAAGAILGEGFYDDSSGTKWSNERYERYER